MFNIDLDFVKNMLLQFEPTPLNIFLSALATLIVLFLVIKLTKKTGVWLLLLTMGLDFISGIFFDSRAELTIVDTVIKVLYIISILYIVFKIISLFKRAKTNNKVIIYDRNDREDIRPELKKKSSISRFFKYTGSFPFLMMIIINIADSNNFLDPSLKNLLNSLSFLYMVFKTSLNTYKRVDKEKDLRNLFKNISFLKSTKTIQHDDVRKAKTGIDRRIKDNRKSDINESIENENLADLNKIEFTNVFSDNIANILTRDFTGEVKNVTIRLTDLRTAKVSTHSSRACMSSIKAENIYKLDLEFKDYNNYDYGRFVDLLILYSKNSDDFKFELEIVSRKRDDLKIIFFDPINVYFVDSNDTVVYSGKNLSMDFLKYKANLVSNN